MALVGLLQEVVVALVGLLQEVVPVLAEPLQEAVLEEEEYLLRMDQMNLLSYQFFS